MISSLPQVVGLFCLVLLSAFFSSAEISLSAASKTRLMALSEDGDRRAAMVLEMREHPGQFFSALQIGLNATALLGGLSFNGYLRKFCRGKIGDTSVLLFRSLSRRRSL